jgi:hypothetical protein
MPSSPGQIGPTSGWGVRTPIVGPVDAVRGEVTRCSTGRHGQGRVARTGARSILSMCRNITTLRGLQPEVTRQEIEAAARQFVRKVSGLQTTSSRTEEPFDKAVRKVSEATVELLAELPLRHQPPATVPPLRRLKAKAG